MFTNRPAMKREYQPKQESGVLATDGLEGMRDNLYFIRESVQRRLLTEFDGEVNQENNEQIRQMIEVFFNQQRRHSAIDYVSPAEYERNRLSVRLAA